MSLNNSIGVPHRVHISYSLHQAVNRQNGDELLQSCLADNLLAFHTQLKQKRQQDAIQAAERILSSRRSSQTKLIADFITLPSQSQLLGSQKIRDNSSLNPVQSSRSSLDSKPSQQQSDSKQNYGIYGIQKKLPQLDSSPRSEYYRQEIRLRKNPSLVSVDSSISLHKLIPAGSQRGSLNSLVHSGKQKTEEATTILKRQKNSLHDLHSELQHSIRKLNGNQAIREASTVHGAADNLIAEGIEKYRFILPSTHKPSLNEQLMEEGILSRDAQLSILRRQFQQQVFEDQSTLHNQECEMPNISKKFQLASKMNIDGILCTEKQRERKEILEKVQRRILAKKNAINNNINHLKTEESYNKWYINPEQRNIPSLRSSKKQYPFVNDPEYLYNSINNNQDIYEHNPFDHQLEKQRAKAQLANQQREDQIRGAIINYAIIKQYARGLADTGTRIPLFMKNVMPPDTIKPRPKIQQQSTRYSNQDKNNQNTTHFTQKYETEFKETDLDGLSEINNKDSNNLTEENDSDDNNYLEFSENNYKQSNYVKDSKNKLNNNDLKKKKIQKQQQVDKTSQISDMQLLTSKNSHEPEHAEEYYQNELNQEKQFDKLIPDNLSLDEKRNTP